MINKHFYEAVIPTVDHEPKKHNVFVSQHNKLATFNVKEETTFLGITGLRVVCRLPVFSFNMKRMADIEQGLAAVLAALYSGTGVFRAKGQNQPGYILTITT